MPRLAPAFLAPFLESGQAHEPGHPPASAGQVAVAELFVDAWRSIGALGLGVDGGDLLEQLGVGDLSARRNALSWLVVVATGDLEDAAGVLQAVTCDTLAPPTEV